MKPATGAFHLKISYRLIAANGQGFMQVGNWNSVRLEPLLIENMLMKLNTKADSYSSAGTEAGICK